MVDAPHDQSSRREVLRRRTEAVPKLAGAHAFLFSVYMQCPCKNTTNARNPFGDRQLVNSRRPHAMTFCMPHIETPQKTLPPQTPRVSFCGDQLILLTSYSHCQDALGPRSVPLAGTGFRPVWLIRSHINTRLSSAPEARCPLRVGDHSMVLIDAS